MYNDPSEPLRPQGRNKQRRSVPGKTTGAELTRVLAWIAAESDSGTQEARGGDLAELAECLPETQVFDGSLAVTINPQHGPRLLDRAMAAFIKLAGIVGCSVVLNKRKRSGSGKEHGERAYPALCFPTRHGRKPSQPHVSLRRLAIDAPAGQKVAEASDDYRDQRAGNLALDETSAASFGREDTIRELLEIFKLQTSIGKPMPFGIATYEALLRQVFRLQDKQRGLL